MKEGPYSLPEQEHEHQLRSGLSLSRQKSLPCTPIYVYELMRSRQYIVYRHWEYLY